MVLAKILVPGMRGVVREYFLSSCTFLGEANAQFYASQYKDALIPA